MMAWAIRFEAAAVEQLRLRTTPKCSVVSGTTGELMLPALTRPAPAQQAGVDVLLIDTADAFKTKRV